MLALDATPIWFTTATFGADELHFEIKVISCVEPSLKVAVAVNGSIAPRRIVGADGVIAMLTIVAFETVSVVVAAVRPL